MVSQELILLGVSIFLFLGVLASKASDWLAVPALLVFLFIGMLAGSDGPGGIYFDDAYISQFLGVFALVYILFSGGLGTKWKAVRPVVYKALTLSTLGVLITACTLGAFSVWILDLTWLEGLLLGSIVSSTDAAAVFAVLRSRNVSLKGYLEPLLEFESGSNDPMAVFLTVGFIQLVLGESESILSLFPMFAWQMTSGFILGYFFSKGAVYIINRLHLGYEGLYPVFLLATSLFIYAATATIQGNGFLAVYVAGIVIGNSSFVHKRSLIRFSDGIAWLMQIVMFLTLGLLVFPKQLVTIIGSGMMVSLFLMFIARPLSIFSTMIWAGLNFREMALVSWVGLRGAVPIILATFPLLAGVPEADRYFNIVFFIVLTSVAIQGPLIQPIAKLLKVDAPFASKVRAPLEFEPSEAMKGEMIEIPVSEKSDAINKRILELQLPAGALIVLINREGNFLVPSGGTPLQAGDILLMLTHEDTLPEIHSRFGID
ncbi:MAG: potassium/proton antiporter [bacterium]|jgi:cell volume regulation protein A